MFIMNTLLQIIGLFLTPEPVRYTRDEAQTEMGVTFERIERAARWCAADNGLTAIPALLGVTLHASYFQRLLYQNAHVFEDACAVFLPEALAHRAPALARATHAGFWTDWDTSETVCTAYWCRPCPYPADPALSPGAPGATNADLPPQFWVELDTEQSTFLPHTLEGHSLLHTLFVTRDEVWVAAHWLHVDDLVHFGNAAWQARNLTEHAVQHIPDHTQQQDHAPWVPEGLCPMQLRETVNQPARGVSVMGCRFHHLYSV